VKSLIFDSLLYFTFTLVLYFNMEYLTALVGEALQRPAELQRKDPNPLTYPKSSKIFSHELFRNPTSEYRGCPFWAWNTKLDKDQLLRQIDNFKAMGMGGFHMHVRTGLDTEYMGSEYAYSRVYSLIFEFAASCGTLKSHVQLILTSRFPQVYGYCPFLRGVC